MDTHLSPPPLSRELLTIEQVAQRWGVSRDLVELAIKQGHLKCLRLSPRNIRVAVEALEEYEAQASLGLSPLERQAIHTRANGPSSTTNASTTRTGQENKKRGRVSGQQERLLSAPRRSSS